MPGDNCSTSKRCFQKTLKFPGRELLIETLRQLKCLRRIIHNRNAHRNTKAIETSTTNHPTHPQYEKRVILEFTHNDVHCPCVPHHSCPTLHSPARRVTSTIFPEPELCNTLSLSLCTSRKLFFPQQDCKKTYAQPVQNANALIETETEKPKPRNYHHNNSYRIAASKPHKIFLKQKLESRSTTNTTCKTLTMQRTKT